MDNKLLLTCAFDDKEGDVWTMYGHMEALPKQLALRGGGNFFSLWGKCSSDPSLSISYFPFINK